MVYVDVDVDYPILDELDVASNTDLNENAARYLFIQNKEVTLNEIDENYYAYGKSESLSVSRTFNNASLAPKVIPSRPIDWCKACLEICITNPRVGACVNRCHKLGYC